MKPSILITGYGVGMAEGLLSGKRNGVGAAARAATAKAPATTAPAAAHNRRRRAMSLSRTHQWWHAGGAN